MQQNILDHIDFKESQPPNYGKIISYILVLCCILIWVFLIEAGDLPYDENLANLLMGFLLSLLLLIALGILYFWKKLLWKQNSIAISIYFISSSPPVVAIVCMNYQFVFGKVLAV